MSPLRTPGSQLLCPATEVHLASGFPPWLFQKTIFSFSSSPPVPFHSLTKLVSYGPLASLGIKADYRASPAWAEIESLLSLSL